MVPLKGAVLLSRLAGLSQQDPNPPRAIFSKKLLPTENTGAAPTLPVLYQSAFSHIVTHHLECAHALIALGITHQKKCF